MSRKRKKYDPPVVLDLGSIGNGAQAQNCRSGTNANASCTAGNKAANQCNVGISALSNCHVRRDVAMTGEVTLRGQVLPVGGLREKVMAAHRAGIKNMIIPSRNEKDLVEIPKKIYRDLNLIMVQSMDEVLDIALLPITTQAKKKTKNQE